MTIETCLKRLEIAKSRGDQKEIEFWEERIKRKLERGIAAGQAQSTQSPFFKYKDLQVSEILGEKKDAKKSKG
jgi:hypothetical protein